MTTNRWAKILRKLGHKVSINAAENRCDLLVAIHAERTGKQLLAFGRKYPDRPTVLLLAGTDIYSPKGFSARATNAIDKAEYLVTLEPNAKAKLNPRWRAKANVIPQSAIRPRRIPEPLKSCFEVSLCGHLRPVKQPFFAAEAALHLPPESKIRINHYGKALCANMKQSALAWMKKSDRYRWAGLKPHWQTRQLIARSQLLINTSLSESSANSIVEAIVSGTPVLASAVVGNKGILTASYPGLFPVASPHKLAKLIFRLETDKKLFQQLKSRCVKIARNHTFNVEAAAWKSLLAKIFPDRSA